jgi:Dimerisation domain
MEYIWPGIIVAQALHAAAKLGIGDLLSSGPKSAAELATDSRAHAPSLDCLLRALSTLGVFATCATQKFRRDAKVLGATSIELRQQCQARRFDQFS